MARTYTNEAGVQTDKGGTPLDQANYGQVRSADEENARTRAALAAADGRREYSAAELVQQNLDNAPMPYVDVIGEAAIVPIHDPADAEAPAQVAADAEAQLPDAEIERLQQDANRAESELESEQEARRKALEAERDRVNAELQGMGDGE